jgi:hypothetical protein
MICQRRCALRFRLRAERTRKKAKRYARSRQQIQETKKNKKTILNEFFSINAPAYFYQKTEVCHLTKKLVKKT